MFGKIVKELMTLNIELASLRQSVDELVSNDHFYYIVEFTFKDNKVKSFPLYTLTDVNDYINRNLLMGSISDVSITKTLDFLR